MQQRDALSDIVVCAVRGCCIRITDSGVWYKKLDRDEIQPEKEGPDGSIEGPVPDSFLCHHGSLDEGGRVAHLVGSDFFTDEPDDEFDFDFDYDPGYYDYEEDYGNQWDSDDEPGMFGFHPDGYNIAAIRWD